MEINWIALILAGISAMVVGSLWYGPLFMKPWMKLNNHTPRKMKSGEMGMMYAFTYVCAVVTAYVLSLIIHSMGMHGLTQGATTGAVVWFGLVATSMATNYMFSSRKLNLYFIDAGNFLVTFVVMGAIIGMFS